jgi:o-succinylbenzoate synthase
MISCFDIKLPLVHHFVSALSTTTHREGVLIKLSVDGIDGWGEASPFPSLSVESVDEVRAELRALEGRAISLPDSLFELNNMVAALSKTAAGRHGLGSAMLDCMAQKAGLPICALLNKDLRREVPVSHLYSHDDALLHAVMLGAQTIKIKVGIASLEQEVQRVEAIRDIIGLDPKIRLDANGAWSEEQAHRALGAFSKFGIHSIEDPVDPRDLGAMSRLRGQGIDIIADGFVDSTAAVEQIIDAQAADVIVIKPMRVGTPLTAMAIIAKANSAGLSSFVTTTIDGAVARMMALHIASAAPTTRLRACGLNTGGWLADDVGQTPDWSGSHVDSPQQVGLGIEVRP